MAVLKKNGHMADPQTSSQCRTPMGIYCNVDAHAPGLYYSIAGRCNHMITFSASFPTSKANSMWKVAENVILLFLLPTALLAHMQFPPVSAICPFSHLHPHDTSYLVLLPFSTWCPMYLQVWWQLELLLLSDAVMWCSALWLHCLLMAILVPITTVTQTLSVLVKI